VWQILSEFSEVQLKLVNPQAIKKMPGRKTDKKDAEWLADLTRVGMIQPSYIPEVVSVELRESTRLRKSFTQQLTVIKNEIHNVLQRSSIKLSSFLNDIYGVAGMKFLNLLFEGVVIDLETIQPLMNARMKASAEEILEAMNGRLSRNDRYLIDILLTRLKSLQYAITDLEVHIQEQVLADADLFNRLQEIPGISKNTAAIVMAEIGINVDAFQTEQAIGAWSGLAPGNNESAGKSHSGKTPHGNKYLKAALSQSAMMARMSKGSELAQFYNRLAGRIGKAKAVITLAHKLLRIIYVMIRDGSHYDEAKLKSRPFPLERPAQ
jgi:transposase